MENKISVPTDNIFKFYALFSLLLFIFSVGSALYLNQRTNDQIISLLIEYKILEEEKSLAPVKVFRKEVLERQIEVAISDKSFIRWSLAVLTAASVFGMAYGFTKWHKEVQPLSDEMARVQLDIAKLQLEKLKAEDRCIDT